MNCSQLRHAELVSASYFLLGTTKTLKRVQGDGRLLGDGKVKS